MNNKPTFFRRIGARIRSHKKTTFFVIVLLIILGYWLYRRATAANAAPQYVVSMARYGTITQTVTGTGQVTASNQLDVKSQVSGTIQTINAQVGQPVHSGDLLATIDSTNAALDLENARLAMAKLTQPAKTSDITAANNNLVKSYNDAFSAVSNTYLNLPPIISGLKDLFYSQNGYLSNQKSSNMTSTGKSYRDAASDAYDRAIVLYQNSLAEFQGLKRNSATSSLDTLFDDAQATVKALSDAMTLTQNAVTYISRTQPEYSPSLAVSASSNTTTWGSELNNDIGNILSASNNVSSSLNALSTLLAGADQLDIETQQLSLKQKQQAYTQYFIRAPFDGIVGRIPVNRYDQASGGTVIATVVGTQKVVTIALDEVDAAKVADGQLVNITFDAIDGLQATGTVSQVDQVGTVVQGVVSYNVKIVINTADDRIKPGMSVSATIVTNEKPNVLVVPSSAVKSMGNAKYVEVLDAIATSSIVQTSSNANVNGPTTGSARTRNFGQFGRNASTTTALGNMASTTRSGFASSTRRTGSMFVSANFGLSNNITVTSSIAPRKVTVAIGAADDTNTEITGGLTRGSFVVTRTITTGATQTTSAPSILNSLGGARGGAAGGVRAGAVRGN